jgi:NAD(P)-dependent dehydrogenase (short-subunit alcohol dehydrogenase family)
MQRNLAEQIVMITGAVGNLGAAAVRAFHACGARVVALDRGEDRLAPTFPELVASPEHFLMSGVDMGSTQSVANAVEKTIGRFGRLDVLVNTVGGFRGGLPMRDADPADWDAMFELNVKTTLNACRAAIPAMTRRRRGSIVNVASIAALRGEADLAAYCASKAAVVRLTESLSAELRSSGINVNCVLPGALDTPQNRKAAAPGAKDDWVRLDDVADVITFLASSAAKAVHGAAIPILGAACESV